MAPFGGWTQESVDRSVVTASVSPQLECCASVTTGVRGPLHTGGVGMQRRTTVSWMFAVVTAVSAVLVAAGPAPLTSPAAADATSGAFTAVQNVRLVNTDSGLGGSSAPFSSGETRTYQLEGVGGLPTSGIDSVVLTVSVVKTTTTTQGSLVVYEAGTARPAVTNMRITQTNAPDSNTALVRLSSDGKFSVYVSHGATDVIIDVQGYTRAGGSALGGLQAITATRIVDSRSGIGTATAPLPAGGYRDIQVGGVAGVPTNAESVFVNVISLGATRDGYLKLFPPSLDGSAAAPAARYAAGSTSATGLIAQLDSAGRVRVQNYVSGSTTDVVIDIQGYFSDSAGAATFSPVSTRIYDSRPGRIPAGGVVDVLVAGTGIVPAEGVDAVLVNATVLTPSSTGFLRMWPSGAAEPGTSVANFNAGQSTSNVALVVNGSDGRVVLRNHSSDEIDVVLDVQGWLGPDEGDPEDRPEPPPPAMTPYGVDEYELEDLTQLAAEDGISVAQAVARYGWHDEFVLAAAELSTEYPETFAYAELPDYEDSEPIVAFTSAVPSTASENFAALPVSVDLVSGAKYSEATTSDMTPRIRDAIMNQTSSAVEILVEPDPASGTFRALVYDPNSAANTATTSEQQTEAAAQDAKTYRQSAIATVQTEMPSEPLPEIQVMVTTNPVVSHEFLSGGVKIGQKYGPFCTSGFPVIETETNAGGLITADHCNNSLPLYSVGSNFGERPRLHPKNRSLPRSRGDIQLHRTYGEPVGASFYVRRTQARHITGWLPPGKGLAACLYGRTTNGYKDGERTCARIKKLGVSLTDPVHGKYDNLAMMTKPVSSRGDSGGPWYNHGNALGVHSGTVACGFLYLSDCSAFTPVWQNWGHIGARLSF